MQKKDKKAMLNVLEEILYEIRNGVVLKDGTVRSYDILDYYQNPYINSVMDINTNFDLIRNSIERKDLITFRKFMSENHPGTLLDSTMIKDMFSIKYEINTLKDKNGMPIPGTGRVITNNEKRMMIDYIIQNNLPLRSKIYKLALSRYISNELVLEDTKKLKKL